jgi:hypothetical protein
MPNKLLYLKLFILLLRLRGNMTIPVKIIINISLVSPTEEGRRSRTPSCNISPTATM